MAFTTYDKVVSWKSCDWDEWGENAPYFYIEDIQEIMAQTIVDPATGKQHPVKAFQCCPAKFRNEEGKLQNNMILIGLIAIEDDDGYGNIKVKYRQVNDKNMPGAKIALGCRQFNNFGGVGRTTPTLDNSIVVPPVEIPK